MQPQLATQSKWKKSGVARLSRSNKVVLLAVYELDSQKWLIVDVEELLDLIAGFKTEIAILEHSGD